MQGCLKPGPGVLDPGDEPRLREV